MNQGFIIAQKQSDGTIGRPIGNNEGAIMVFEDLGQAAPVCALLRAEHGDLSIFQINVSIVGEVVI